MRIPKTADVVIVGGGIMGMSVAYHLACRGCSRIVLLEKETGPGTQITRHCGGGFRHQFSTPLNIKMSLLSNQMFENFGQELGQEIDIDRRGYLFVLTEGDDLAAFQQAVRLQNELGVQTEWLDKASLQEYWPAFELGGAVAATFCRHDGLLNTTSVLQGYMAAAEKLGVKFFFNLPVCEIEVEHDRVRGVTTPLSKIATPVVVNAAGLSAAALGEMVQVDLPVTAVPHQVFIVAMDAAAAPSLPVTLFPARKIGFLPRKGELQVGTTRHSDHSDLPDAVDCHVEKEMHKLAQALLPQLREKPIIARWTSAYAMTPDSQPILGSVPPVEGFYCITGFSGHGFMHSPISGLLLSEEILDGRASTLDITPFRFERFYQAHAYAEQQAF